ncbi:hypothetical protein ANCCEY_09240 [Ancylostoma ceylanicum]|uniref:Cationic amino acid transporter C-terminal domain-containing protein n=1 Tax=Ancylostoma ceylanicum TaxID=53326 RepID=A0A0D6LHV6_9BILA|nr:hypothetical protein ANCCEY_09240 [Ancylostoma ceylanicum]
MSEEYDFTALCAALFSVLILCCNLRVVGTVSLCLVVVAILMTASCTMVGFFHADPQNWIDAQFFRFGFDGVLKAVCALSCAFAGVDATSYLFEESKNPRKKVPVLLPMLVTFLSLFFFVVVMIFSLSTDVSKLPENVLVPEMFSVLNVPAAKVHYEAGFQRMRYMLTVSAVCGLSGAVLSSFLPGSRIINALSSDRLLPLPADMTRQPVMSVFIFSILVSFGLLINRDVLLHLIFFTTPLKMIIAVCLVLLQHYRAEPVGIPHETSQYKSIRKKRQQVSLTGDDGSVVTSTLTHDDGDSDCSADTSTFVQMTLAKREAQRHQRRLEKKQEAYLSEKVPVLAKSVSHYSSMAPVAERNETHNCVADSCSVRDDSDDETPHRIHLYVREVPELPFVESFHGCDRPSTPVDLGEQYRRQAKVPFFPYISYFTLFILIFALATTKAFTVLLFSCWLFLGAVLYFAYGFWNSTQKHRVHDGLGEDDDAEMYRAIIGNDYANHFE